MRRNGISYRYCVDVIANNWMGKGKQHRTETIYYYRDSKDCSDEVLEEANACYTGEVTCQIKGIYILENDRIVDVVSSSKGDTPPKSGISD